MSALHLSDKIEITPGVCGGQPRISGSRFTVKQIAMWHEYMGLSADEIAHEYHLNLSDIYAALSYFFDHREEIVQAMEAEEDLAAEIQNHFPSKIKRLRG
ncbi:MAG: DUF433 domain-containing protein [Lewinellaceae bacterium]|nr:DUF433 domain-containing protein [Lewinellaceae bacterium]